MNILISAYAVSPYRGSEYAVAWNTIQMLSKDFNVWVLYGASDDHMGDTYSLKAYIKENNMQNICFIEVHAGQLALTINKLNKMGLNWIFYIAFSIWQKKALQTARTIVQQQEIDLVHQLGPIGFREPGYLWKINKPYVWGPIGGTHIIDNRLLIGKSLSSRVLFFLKNTVNYFQVRYSSKVKKALSRADVLLASTKEDLLNISQVHHKTLFHFPENGIMGKPKLNTKKFKNIENEVRLVWSGTHIERKNLQLCLRALRIVKSKNWVLHILGSGPLTKMLKSSVEAVELSKHIIWHGLMDRNQAVEIMNNSHLHIITSIAEANTTVLFEAMSFGVPTLTLDHCGMADIVCDNCGVKIALDNEIQMGKLIANKLDDFFQNPHKLINLANGVLMCANSHTWENKLIQLESFYNKAVKIYNRRILEIDNKK